MDPQQPNTQQLENQIQSHLQFQEAFQQQLLLHPQQPPTLEDEPAFMVDPIENFLEQNSTQHFPDPSVGPIISRSNLPLCYTNNMLMCSTTVIGSRPEQQDRYVMAPSLLGLVPRLG